MWNKTVATKLLKIQYPIVQGPFGGRFSSVKLLSAVSNGGGLGSFGLNAYRPEEILEVGRQIKAATHNPYNLNLWIPLKNDPVREFGVLEHERWKKAYAPHFQKMDLPLPALPEAKKPVFDEQLAAVLTVSPPAISFIFGIPSPEVIKEIKQSGTVIIVAATTVEEALLINETDIDLILATGKEAGGHRPSFLEAPEHSLRSTKELVIAVLKKVRKPVIAAGGIANGQHVLEYLKMGVAAAQLGTAFLATDESGATNEHKNRLHAADSYATELTRAFSGRLARTLSNTFFVPQHSTGGPVYAPYPLQGQLLGKLMDGYKEAKMTDKVAFWAGEPSSILNQRSAGALLRSIVNEVEELKSFN